MKKTTAYYHFIMITYYDKYGNTTFTQPLFVAFKLERAEARLTEIGNHFIQSIYPDARKVNRVTEDGRRIIFERDHYPNEIEFWIYSTELDLIDGEEP